MKLPFLSALVPLLLAAAAPCRALAVPAEPAFEEPSMASPLDAARAVPYVDPSTGEHRGYVIPPPPSKTVAGNDDFRKRRIRPGTILRGPVTPVTR